MDTDLNHRPDTESEFALRVRDQIAAKYRNEGRCWCEGRITAARMERSFLGIDQLWMRCDSGHSALVDLPDKSTRHATDEPCGCITDGWGFVHVPCFEHAREDAAFEAGDRHYDDIRAGVL
ncbi:MAG: hypothetical protein WD739_09160 [Actinomycetota bacterium]